MAYQFLRRQARELLDGILENDKCKEYMEYKEINKKDMSIEDLYIIVDHDPLIFFFNIVSPMLRVYGINFVFDGTIDHKHYLSGDITSWHDIIIRDYYEAIDGYFVLKFMISVDSTDVYIDISNNGLDKMTIDFILDPLKFFEDLSLSSSYKFMIKVIKNNISYYTAVFWRVKQVCDKYLVQDVTIELVYLAIELVSCEYGEEYYSEDY